MAPLTEVRPSWSRARWLTSIAITCGVQFALVAVLTNRSAAERRTGNNTLVTLPARLSREIQALTDPTLLALGGKRGFSRIWMDVPPLKPLDGGLEEPPYWQELDPHRLASSFQTFAAAAEATQWDMLARLSPERLHPAEPVAPTPIRTNSTLRLASPLTGWTLLAPAKLPSWPAADLLLPTKVRVVVDDRGMVMSAIVQSPSGLPAADQFALQTANQLRFTPVEDQEQPHRLQFGDIIFDWNTTLKEAATEPPPNS